MTAGKLTLVPTPIGNLKDITLRALEVLESADGVLAEDTRVSGKLLKHYEVKTKLISFHQHNEHSRLDGIIELLLKGSHFAMITDAGTPGISDPGFLLVRECRKNGIDIECLPGATAFVPAIVVSGLPSDRFVFEGFLPTKKGRLKRLEELRGEKRTMVFYESPYRLVKTLNAFAEQFGKERKASVSREISKMYEENIQGSLEELILHFGSKSIKGEIVVVVEGTE